MDNIVFNHIYSTTVGAASYAVEEISHFDLDTAVRISTIALPIIIGLLTIACAVRLLYQYKFKPLTSPEKEHSTSNKVTNGEKKEEQPFIVQQVTRQYLGKSDNAKQNPVASKPKPASVTFNSTISMVASSYRAESTSQQPSQRFFRQGVDVEASCKKVGETYVCTAIDLKTGKKKSSLTTSMKSAHDHWHKRFLGVECYKDRQAGDMRLLAAAIAGAACISAQDNLEIPYFQSVVPSYSRPHY